MSKKSSNFAAGKKLNSNIYMEKLIVLVFICVTCAMGSYAGDSIPAVGSSVEMAAIATIATGYYKMHHTVDVYNTHCYKRPEPRPYWALQASEKGIGLAYKF